MKDMIEIIALALIVGFFCFFAGGIFGLNVMRREAIKSGHGEYYIDVDSEKDFRWKTNCIPTNP